MVLIGTIVEQLIQEVARYPDLRDSLENCRENISSNSDFVSVWPALKPLLVFPVCRIREVALSQISKLFAHEIVTVVKIATDLTPQIESLLNAHSVLSDLKFNIKDYYLGDEILVGVCQSLLPIVEPEVQLQGIKLLLTVISSSNNQV